MLVAGVAPKNYIGAMRQLSIRTTFSAKTGPLQGNYNTLIHPCIRAIQYTYTIDSPTTPAVCLKDTTAQNNR